MTKLRGYWACGQKRWRRASMNLEHTNNDGDGDNTAKVNLPVNFQFAQSKSPNWAGAGLLPPPRPDCYRRLMSSSVSSSISAACSRLVMFSPSIAGQQPTMASADFCCPIRSPFESRSQWQDHRPPRVIAHDFPANTCRIYVHGLRTCIGLRIYCLLTHRVRLLCDSCSSGQRFAFGFLQIPPRSGHPCRSANCSPCWANSGLAPPSHPATTT